MGKLEILGYRAVTEVLPLSDYRLKLTFETGEIRIFDVKPYFSSSYFAPMQDQKKFEKVRLFLDTVAWANGADIAPERLYSDSIPIEEYEAQTGQTL